MLLSWPAMTNLNRCLFILSRLLIFSLIIIVHHIVLFVQMFLSLPGFTDNVYTHLLAGLGAGIFAVCIGSPLDVVCSASALYRTISLILFDE
jgi:hypothetical protein